MFFILSKVLFFLLQPLVWVVALLILSLGSKVTKRRKTYQITALVVLLFFSNQFIFNEVCRVWENQIPTFRANEKFDVAIVLGGISNYDEFHSQSAFHGNSERLMNVLPLYFSGQVKKILFAGGSGRLDKENAEALHIEKYLLSLGIKQKDILLDTNSRNTYENAKFAVELVNKDNRLLLSTSATHMVRSLACFKKLGSSPAPFSVDYMSYEDNRFELYKLLAPSPRVIMQWYWLLHEWVGILSYKVKGYC
ncbi:YdcF family protein [Vicingaceae bacterium]|nr:YdcF family protein [Vicingaceae bacterium]